MPLRSWIFVALTTVIVSCTFLSFASNMMSESEFDPRNVVVLPSKPQEAWRKALLYRERDGKKTYRSVPANIVSILTHDPKWKGVIAYDAFRLEIAKISQPPWHPDAMPPGEKYPCEFTESDVTRLQDWLVRNYYGLEAGPKVVDAALRVVAERNTQHGPRDYLKSLVWDGEKRLGSLFVKYFGAEDTEYVRSIGVLWMISAVARAFEPGCQVDYLVVLEGPQGTRKTTGLEALVGKHWFSDTRLDISSKDGEQSLQGVWVHCFDELDALRKNEQTKVKNYITLRVARFRPSYGRKAGAFPRQNAFCATTNEQEYFDEKHRRFWPVPCGLIHIAAIRADRDQLWAEAVALYLAKHEWWPNASLAALCAAEQAKRIHGDPWEEPISLYANAPFAISTDANRRSISKFTVKDVLVHALEKSIGECTKSDEMRVAAILRDAGFAKQREWDGAKQLVFWAKMTPRGDLIQAEQKADLTLRTAEIKSPLEN